MGIDQKAVTVVLSMGSEFGLPGSDSVPTFRDVSWGMYPNFHIPLSSSARDPHKIIVVITFDKHAPVLRTCFYVVNAH